MARAKPRSRAKSSALRVRMYRVGFGDFFLVSVPSKTGPKHILVDCGVTRGKTGKGDIASIKTAVRHMAAETGGKLALIIATHRHQDHIIGFSRCAAEFEKFDVEAIWMPYWETEYVEANALDVVQFQTDLEQTALGLRMAALAGAADEHTEEILGLVENATGVGKEGPGGGTNAKSLDLLKNKLGVKPRYYYKGQKPHLPKSLVDAGLQADILGPPPPTATDFTKMKDLKKGVGQYLDALGVGARGESRKKLAPFGAGYIAPQRGDAYPLMAFREYAPRQVGVLPDWTRRYAPELERAVKGALPASLLLTAKQLDGWLNNQSLVVLFTWREKTLLFAGDAQAGNWLYWLYDLDKPKKDPTGEPLSDDGRAILGALDFYKVGHHGSTNSTPISAVKAMGKGFVSMCSVQHDTFGSKKNASEVPREPLMDALAEKSTLVRSDQFAAKLGTATIPAAKGSPARVPKPRTGKLVVGDLYVDYLLS